MKTFTYHNKRTNDSETLEYTDGVAHPQKAAIIVGVLEEIIDVLAEGMPWDSPPVYGVLLRHEQRERGDSITGSLNFVPVPLRRKTAEANHPADVLVLLSKMAQADKDVLDINILHSTVVIHEGWSFSTRLNPEKYEEYRAWQQAGRAVVDHPDAFEVRLATAVDKSGLLYMVSKPRDPRHEVARTVVPFAAPDTASGGGGLIPVALKYFLDSFCTTAPMPEFDTYMESFISGIPT